MIAVIAKHNLALATGHVSADEGLMLLREAKAQYDCMGVPVESSAEPQGAMFSIIQMTAIHRPATA